MFGVTDRTSGSSQFCVEVTDVDCNTIFVTINFVVVVEWTFDDPLQRSRKKRKKVHEKKVWSIVLPQSIFLAHNDWQYFGKISKQMIFFQKMQETKHDYSKKILYKQSCFRQISEKAIFRLTRRPGKSASLALWLFRIAVGTETAYYTSCCAMPSGHCLYGLLFWRRSTASSVFRVGASLESSLSFLPFHPCPRP